MSRGTRKPPFRSLAFMKKVVHGHAGLVVLEKASQDAIGVAANGDESVCTAERLGVITKRQDEPAAGLEGLGNVREQSIDRLAIGQMRQRIAHA